MGVFSSAICIFPLQVQMKELMRELDELRLSRDEAVNGAKETERKLKAMEADVLHFQEVWNKAMMTTRSSIS